MISQHKKFFNVIILILCSITLFSAKHLSAALPQAAMTSKCLNLIPVADDPDGNRVVLLRLIGGLSGVGPVWFYFPISVPSFSSIKYNDALYMTPFIHDVYRFPDYAVMVQPLARSNVFSVSGEGEYRVITDQDADAGYMFIKIPYIPSERLIAHAEKITPGTRFCWISVPKFTSMLEQRGAKHDGYEIDSIYCKILKSTLNKLTGPHRDDFLAALPVVPKAPGFLHVIPFAENNKQYHILFTQAKANSNYDVFNAGINPTSDVRDYHSYMANLSAPLNQIKPFATGMYAFDSNGEQATSNDQDSFIYIEIPFSKFRNYTWIPFYDIERTAIGIAPAGADCPIEANSLKIIQTTFPFIDTDARRGLIVLEDRPYPRSGISLRAIYRYAEKLEINRQALLHFTEKEALCAILGLNKADNPSEAAIRRAYHDRMSKWHPNKVKVADQELATEISKIINTAYTALKDLPSQ